MRIREWPPDERPRERLLAHGANALSDAQLLAIFLGSGLRGRDAVTTARDLLQSHGPLRVLLERPPAQLAKLPGLGPARACLLAGAIAFEELFQGTIDGAHVYPREVTRRALAHNAAAAICGHNHPSGNAEPSGADRSITARLKEALALVDVRLLDHIVVGDGAPVSLAARGWL